MLAQLLYFDIYYVHYRCKKEPRIHYICEYNFWKFKTTWETSNWDRYRFDLLRESGPFCRIFSCLPTTATEVLENSVYYIVTFCDATIHGLLPKNAAMCAHKRGSDFFHAFKFYVYFFTPGSSHEFFLGNRFSVVWNVKLWASNVKEFNFMLIWILWINIVTESLSIQIFLHANYYFIFTKYITRIPQVQFNIQKQLKSKEFLALPNYDPQDANFLGNQRNEHFFKLWRKENA